MKVPNNVAIVGFDNVEAALHVEPRLTTVNVHRDAMGSSAVRRLADGMLLSKVVTANDSSGYALCALVPRSRLIPSIGHSITRSHYTKTTIGEDFL